MKQNTEIDPLLRAYFAGKLNAEEKAVVKQRFASEADFQLDFLLEEERLGRSYKAMLQEIDAENSDGQRPIMRTWAIVIGFMALILLLFVVYFLVSHWVAPTPLPSTMVPRLQKSPVLRDSVPPSPAVPSDGISPIERQDTNEVVRPQQVPPRRGDSLNRNHTMLASHHAGTVQTSWERKENDRDPKVWLGNNRITAPSTLPDYLWESVVRGKVLTHVPVFAIRQKGIRIPADKPKGSIEVLVFQTAYLPTDQYLFGDSLWLFLRRDLREITISEVWVSRNVNGGVHTLHIGAEAFDIRRSAKAAELRKNP